MARIKLREVLDCIEACDALIDYYKGEYVKGLKEEAKNNSDGNARIDYTSMPKEKIKLYKYLKESFLRNLEYSDEFEEYARLIRR